MIRLSGHIDPGDELKFSEIADTIPATEKVEVVLTSNGGSIKGLEIGRIIRERKFETIAYIHCASMCASIWLAGVPRSMCKGTHVRLSRGS
jgi:hypothetical protein